MVIACSSYKTYQIRRAVWNSTLFCFLFLFTIPSEPDEANLFKVDNVLNGVNVYISCFKTRSARKFFCVGMVSSSGWNSALLCFLFLFTIPSDPVEADLFKVDNMLPWCYVYISCFRTRSARNFFCVSMVSSSASFIGRMKTNENKEADLAGRWVRRDLS